MRLYGYLGKYEKALRADLQETYNIDVTALFRERRYVHLLALIDGLPPTSRFRNAMLNDPDTAEQIARQILEQEDQPEMPRWTPALTEFGLTEQMLAQIFDAIQALQATTVSAAGGKPSKPKPFPRPTTEVDRAKERLTREAAHSILSLFKAQFNPNS